MILDLMALFLFNTGCIIHNRKGPATMQVERFNIWEVLKTGWKKFLENPALLILTLLVVAFIGLIPAAVKAILNWIGYPKTEIVYWCVFSFINLITIIFNIGLLKIYLKLAYDEKANYDDLVKHIRHYFRYLGVTILYGLIVVGGLVLLIVPGIMWSIQFQFARYFVVDKEMGPIEALKASSKLTKGCRWDIFGFNVLMLLVTFLGFLCCCIGYLIAIPVCEVATAFVYRRLQETQEGPEILPELPLDPSQETPVVNPENPQPPVE